MPGSHHWPDPSAHEWICQWQVSLSYGERHRLYMIGRLRMIPRGRGRPASLPNKLPTELTTFSTREAAEQHAMLLRARHGDSVAITIFKNRPRETRQQLSLASDWSLQRRPPGQ